MSTIPTIQGIAGLSPRMSSFIIMLRAFLRDYPELNELIEGEETSDRMLLMAAGLALVRYNGTPPASSLSLEGVFQQNHQDVLLMMAVVYVLESALLLQARNQINYSTGGTTVGVNDKAPLYMKMLDYFRSISDQDLKQRKISLNIMSILDGVGVHSEYALVHSSYVFW